jgi:hypothetical protein
LSALAGAFRRGYERGSVAERAGFGVLCSFASTISISRSINYVLERRRPFPIARSLWRRVYNAPRRGGQRVHHFVPGIAIALAAGGAAVLTRTNGCELRFALPFGAGTGLTLDELALLIDLDNPYWRTEDVALAQAAAALIGAGALATRFIVRGARDPSAAPPRGA